MSSVLGVSDAASLALHATAFLAARPGRPVPAKDMAAAFDASEAHLLKVLQRLAKAGLVKATRGPAGGFELAKAAKKVTLKEVYEAIEGPLRTTKCLFGKRACNGKCILGDLLRTIDENVAERLRKTRLSDLRVEFKQKGGRKWDRAGR